MSHEIIEASRGVVYTLPSSFCDALRTREFDQFFREYTGACFSVRTLDGWSWSSSLHKVPEFTATFRTRPSLDAVVDDASELVLGRLFLDGELNLDGNIFALLSVAQYTLRHSDGLSGNLIQTISRLSHHFAQKLVPALYRGSEKQSWQWSPCPLDLPVSFFEPWLGPSLGHSCAFFRTEGEDFESAQRNALDLACEWLALQPCDRLLDLACGWGGFAVHAAARRGTSTLGIAATEMQRTAVAERIKSEALEESCAVELRDLRLRSHFPQKFDKIAQLGIFEQVARCDLCEYFRYLSDQLVPGGLLLLDRLTGCPEADAPITLLPYEFLSDGVSGELQIAEKAGFTLVQLQSQQRDYQDTLRIWIDHLLNVREGVTRLFTGAYRAWMLFLIEVATRLNNDQAQVHRMLLRRRS